MITLPLGSILASMLVLAAASGGPPKVNIEATCRASEIEIKKLFGNDSKVTTSGCLMQENAAWDELVKTWATFTPADRTQCIQPRRHMPSYVEWLTCLETRKDLRRIRDQEKSRGAAPKSARKLAQLTIEL
jgi:hypothetical protein